MGLHSFVETSHAEEVYDMNSPNAPGEGIPSRSIVLADKICKKCGKKARGTQHSSYDGVHIDYWVDKPNFNVWPNEDVSPECDPVEEAAFFVLTS